MATLTADDLAYVRSMLPTVDANDPAFVSDYQLDYLYANKAGDDVDKTIAYALRQMCAKSAGLVGRTNTATGDTVQSQQEREAICAMAETWAAMTGIPSGKGGILTISAIDLNIDSDEDDA